MRPGDDEKTETQAPAYVPGMPDSDEVGTTTKTDSDGVTTITKVEEVKDSNDNVIGYKKTVTTQQPEKAGQPSETTKKDTSETEETVTTETEIVLPEEPESSESTDAATGETTTVKVEKIMGTGKDEGKVIGYKTTTTVTDKDGNKLSSASKSIFGRKTTTVTTVETPVKTITTTVFTRGVTEEGTVVTATDRELKASMSAVRAGNNNGTVDMSTIQPDVEKEMKWGTIEGIDGQFQWWADLFDRPETGWDNVDMEEYPYQWRGEYGMESLIRVEAGSEQTW